MSKNRSIRGIEDNVWRRALAKSAEKGVNVGEYISHLIENDLGPDTSCRCMMCDEITHGETYDAMWSGKDRTICQICKECKFCMLMSGAKTIQGYKKFHGL